MDYVTGQLGGSPHVAGSLYDKRHKLTKTKICLSTINRQNTHHKHVEKRVLHHV